MVPIRPLIDPMSAVPWYHLNVTSTSHVFRRSEKGDKTVVETGHKVSGDPTRADRTRQHDM